MFVWICLFVSVINGILGTFTTNPPPAGYGCSGNNLQLTWEYSTANNPLVVQWKKDGTSILDWNVLGGSYSYPSTFDSSTLTHDNTNGQITLKGINETYSGTYACEMTDSTGTTFASASHNLQVYDLLTSGMNCSCNINRINCNLPSSITQVTVNNTNENLPFTPIVEGSYVVCMIGDQTNCRENNVDICETIDLCPTGSTSPPSSSGIPGWLIAVIVICSLIAAAIIVVPIVIYCCSNKNCITHNKCWCCKEKFYSDFPTAPYHSMKVAWNIDHFQHYHRYCRKTICNNRCCSFFLCYGCCLKDLPAVRDEEIGNPLKTTKTNQNRNLKVGKIETQNDSKNGSDPPVESQNRDLKVDKIETQNDSESGSDPPVERSKSLDSKGKKIYPAIDEHGNKTKNLDPIRHESGTFEATHSITPRPLPLPPIGKHTS